MSRRVTRNARSRRVSSSAASDGYRRQAIAQVHVYPFGGLRRTAEWLTERGTWFAGAAAAQHAEIDIETESQTIAAEAGL